MSIVRGYDAFLYGDNGTWETMVDDKKWDSLARYAASNPESRNPIIKYLRKYGLQVPSFVRSALRENEMVPLRV